MKVNVGKKSQINGSWGWGLQKARMERQQRDMNKLMGVMICSISPSVVIAS
jgi:hypothetical protein